ncbi:MAG: nucleotidyltransferase family protein [Spirochaetota bacterium]
MTLDETIRRITARHAEIKALGVSRLALFGSTVRGNADAQSDLDVLVAFESGRKTFDSYMELKFLLEDLFPELDVDLVTESSLNSTIRDRVLSEARDVA